MEEKLSGVYQAVHKDGSIYYRSSVTFRSKHISLGSFSDCQSAHNCYLEANKILQDSSISIDDFSQFAYLSFDKWIILMNFRDNRIYFVTPIYLKNKFFHYYLSANEILKFDMDDLFYYSSHKILKRGGHLFISEYGMQTSIASRYGIKPYAVLGRDYAFVNGDSTDYRYENIEIFNRYHGVSMVQKGNKTFYKVKIHIFGNNKVGIYPTEEAAAIAYNKAIDCLKKAGINKQYTPNYLEGLSPSVYADIYNSLKISSKIIHYKTTSDL